MKKLFLYFSIMALVGSAMPTLAARIYYANDPKHVFGYNHTITVDPRGRFRTALVLQESLGISFDKDKKTKQFHCRDCKYTSLYKQNMACHIWSHLKIKVQCALCGGAMARTSFINKHRKTCERDYNQFISNHKKFRQKRKKGAVNILNDLRNYTEEKPKIEKTFTFKVPQSRIQC